MARKIPEKKQTLDELVPLYGEQNTQCNTLKKVVADLNAKLKQAIKDAQQVDKDIVIDGWKCKLSVTDESVFNEDALILFAKSNDIDIIRTKEYIDYDALENLIYHGDIKKELLIDMENCKETKTRETLRVSKLKETVTEEN